MLFRSHRLTNRLQTKNYALLSTIASTTTTNHQLVAKSSSVFGNKSSIEEFSKTTNNNIIKIDNQNQNNCKNNNNIMFADVASISNNFPVIFSSSATSFLRRPIFAAEPKHSKKNTPPSGYYLQQLRFCSTAAAAAVGTAAESSSQNNNKNHIAQKSADDSEKDFHKVFYTKTVESFEKCSLEIDGKKILGEKEFEKFIGKLKENDATNDFGKILYEWYVKEQIKDKKDDAAKFMLLGKFTELAVKCQVNSSAPHFLDVCTTLVSDLADQLRIAQDNFHKNTVAKVVMKILEGKKDPEGKDDPFFGAEGFLGKNGIAVVGYSEEMLGLKSRWIKTDPANNWSAGSNNFLFDSTVLLTNVPEVSRVSKLLSDAVVIFTGGSGTGKTTVALLASAGALPLQSSSAPPEAVAFYFITGTKGLAIHNSGSDENNPETKSRRNFDTAIRLLCAVANTLASSDDFVHPNDLKACYNPKGKTWNSCQNVKEYFAEKFRKFELVPSPSVRVTIIVDEIGKSLELLFGLTSQWKTIRKFLAPLLGVEESNLFLVVAGTGAENFEISPCGTTPNSYKVFALQNAGAHIFRELLQRVSAMNVVPPPPPQQQQQQHNIANQCRDTTNLFADALLKHLYDKNLGRADEVTYRFQQLIRNARCAALAIQKILDMKPPENCATSPEFIHSVLPGLSAEVVSRFTKLNGLRDLSDKEVFDHLVRAIRIVVDRHETVDQHTWRHLAIDCGLITDTSRVLKDKEFIEEQIKRRESQLSKLKELKESWIDPESKDYLHLVIDPSFPRFRLSEPAIPMFLGKVNSLSYIDPRVRDPNGNSFVIEKLISDFLAVCALVKEVPPASSETKKGLFDIPRKLFRFGNTTPVKLYTGSLAFKFEKEMLTSPTHAATTIDAKQNAEKGIESIDSKLKTAIDELKTATDEKKVNEAKEKKKNLQNEKNTLHQKIADYNRQLAQYEAFVQFQDENADALKAIKAGKAVAVIMNGDKASGFDVAALAKNKCFCVEIKYGTTDFGTGDIRTFMKKMEVESLLENLASCCREEKSTDVVEIHNVCLLSGPERFNGFGPSGSAEQNVETSSWETMLEEAPKFKSKNITCHRHIAYMFDSNSNNGTETVFGNLYPVISLALPDFGEKPASLKLEDCKFLELSPLERLQEEEKKRQGFPIINNNNLK
jgi:hypothetical protein